MALNRSSLKGIGFALLGFAVFSTHDTLIKYLGGTYAPFQILFFSVLFSFPLVSLMLMRDPQEGTLKPVNPGWVALRTGAGVISGTSAFYAFSVLPLAQVYVFIFAAPLLITILSIPVLGETVGVHRWAAVALGLIGVIVVLRPGSDPLTLGHIAGLTAATGSAVVSVVTRKIGRQERAAVLMLYPMMANVVLMGALLPFVYQEMPIRHLGLLAVVAAFGFSGGLCIIAAYRSGDAAIIAPMQYSQIIWGALFGLLFFAETIEANTLYGALIIIAAGLYVVVRESLGGRSANTPVLRTRTRPGAASSPNIGAALRATEASAPIKAPLANDDEAK